MSNPTAQSVQVSELSASIGAAEDNISDALDALISDLRDKGACRIHRTHSASQEIAAMKAVATHAAIKALIEYGWIDLPDEVLWLHVGRHAEPPIERIAAQ